MTAAEGNLATDRALLLRAATRNSQEADPPLLEPYRSIVQNKPGQYWVMWGTEKHYKNLERLVKMKSSFSMDRKAKRNPFTLGPWVPRARPAADATAAATVAAAVPAAADLPPRV